MNSTLITSVTEMGENIGKVLTAKPDTNVSVNVPLSGWLDLIDSIIQVSEQCLSPSGRISTLT